MTCAGVWLEVLNLSLDKGNIRQMPNEKHVVKKELSPFKKCQCHKRQRAKEPFQITGDERDKTAEGSVWS